MNDIGRIHLRTTAPLFYDEYRHNRPTGSFVLVDEQTNATVAAGMLLRPQQLTGRRRPTDMAGAWTAGSRPTRWDGLAHRAPGRRQVDGRRRTRTTCSSNEGCAAFLLDGDDLREGLNADLGYGEGDRVENVRRLGEVAILFARLGHLSIVSAISPYAAGRKAVRERHAALGRVVSSRSTSRRRSRCARPVTRKASTPGPGAAS